MKKDGVRNIVIGAIWIFLGIIALATGTELALFHLIPINGVVVIVIGVIWGGIGVYQLVESGKPAPQPGVGAQQPYPNRPTPV